MEEVDLIRKFTDEDFDDVVDVWLRSGSSVYSFLPRWHELTPDRARKVFDEGIVTQCDIWVGTEDAAIVAFLAMRESYIDRLYVDPPSQRKGWGKQLVAFARELQPSGLELHTHVENTTARSFYEGLGFVAVRFGISPPPESVPDVEYHWRP